MRQSMEHFEAISPTVQMNALMTKLFSGLGNYLLQVANLPGT